MKIEVQPKARVGGNLILYQVENCGYSLRLGTWFLNENTLICNLEWSKTPLPKNEQKSQGDWAILGRDQWWIHFIRWQWETKTKHSFKLYPEFSLFINFLEALFYFPGSILSDLYVLSHFILTLTSDIWIRYKHFP